MIDHAAPVDLAPGVMGMEDCASLVARLRNKKAVTEKYSLLHFAGTQQPPDSHGPDSVYWYPGTGSPAGAPSKVKSDMAPLLRMLQSGSPRPGVPPPSKDVPFQGSGQYTLFAL